MASPFRQFAIDNNLTSDQGYTYGMYRGFYISLKETLGSTKILTISTKLGQNVEVLKSILSVFSEDELPKYCITNFDRKETYLQFTFEIQNDKALLITNFLDRFIDSCHNNNFESDFECPLCNKKFLEGDNVVTVDIKGVFTPVHNECCEAELAKRAQAKEEAKRKAKEKVERTPEEIAQSKIINKGIFGAIIFSLIYMLVLIGAFFFVQFILNNVSDDDQGSSFVRIFQYFPGLAALTAAPIISKGYEVFKGKAGTEKYVTVMIISAITTLVGTFFGFVFSLLTLDLGYSVVELTKLVADLLKGNNQQFRYGFYIYIVVSFGLAMLSLVINFNKKDELEEANADTFEKLD